MPKDKIDFSFPTSDLKSGKNLLSMTADGAIKRLLFGSAVVDIGTLADGVGATGTIPVSGAALGDIVLGVSGGVDLVDMTVTAYVVSAGSVEFRVQNESASGDDFGSTTWRVLVADVT